MLDPQNEYKHAIISFTYCMADHGTCEVFKISEHGDTNQ